MSIITNSIYFYLQHFFPLIPQYIRFIYSRGTIDLFLRFLRLNFKIACSRHAVTRVAASRESSTSGSTLAVRANPGSGSGLRPNPVLKASRRRPTPPYRQHDLSAFSFDKTHLPTNISNVTDEGDIHLLRNLRGGHPFFDSDVP